MNNFNPNTISILLDWDGVLFSWNDAVLNLYQITKTPEVRNKLRTDWGVADILRDTYGILREQLESDIYEAGQDFWLQAPQLPWADKLYTTLYDASNGQVSICTSPGSWPESVAPKTYRMYEVFGCNNLISCKKKEWVARPNALLVDDASYQIKAFELAGGMTFHWPNQYNIEDNLDLVDKSLETLTKKIEFMNHHYDLMQIK